MLATAPRVLTSLIGATVLKNVVGDNETDFDLHRNNGNFYHYYSRTSE